MPFSLTERFGSLGIQTAVGLLISITIIIIVSVNKILFRLKYRLPPGPLSLPFVGHLPFLGDDAQKYFENISKKYGKVFSLYLGTRLTIVVCDFGLIKDICHKDEYTGQAPEVFQFNPEHQHFAQMSGNDWKEQRRFMLSTLRDLGMGRSVGETASLTQVNSFLESLKAKSDGQTVNIREELIPAINNIFFSMLADKIFKPDDKMCAIVKEFQSQTMGYWEQRAKQYYYPFLNNILPYTNTKIRNGLKSIKDFEVELSKEVQSHEETMNEDHKRDFIDYYLAEIKKGQLKTFTKETMLGNVGVLLIIGAETIKMSLEWGFLQMAQFPDIQEKVHKEIIDLVGTHRLPQWSDRNDLPYTQATLLEIWRYSNPLVVNDPRLTTSDTKIGEYDVPQGTTVLMVFGCVQTSKDIWGDPENFRPERFLSDDGKKINDKAEYVLTFSIGKRSCPGETLGKVNIFLYFAAVLQKLRIIHPKEGLDRSIETALLSIVKNPLLAFKVR